MSDGNNGKALTVSRKLAKILNVSRKSHHPIETLVTVRGEPSVPKNEGKCKMQRIKLRPRVERNTCPWCGKKNSNLPAGKKLLFQYSVVSTSTILWNFE